MRKTALVLGLLAAVAAWPMAQAAVVDYKADARRSGRGPAGRDGGHGKGAGQCRYRDKDGHLADRLFRAERSGGRRAYPLPRPARREFRGRRDAWHRSHRRQPDHRARGAMTPAQIADLDRRQVLRQCPHRREQGGRGARPIGAVVIALRAGAGQLRGVGPWRADADQELSG